MAIQQLLSISDKVLQRGPQFLIDLIWIAVVIVLMSTAYGLRPTRRRLFHIMLWFDRSGPRLFLLALILRLVPAIVPAGAEYDINSYHLVGQSLLSGQPLYSSGAAAAHYPYFPLALWAWAGAVALSRYSGLAFPILVKLPVILLDSALAVLVLHVARQGRTTYREDQSPLFSAGLLYAVNPVAILVSAYHGQFDGATLLPLIGSLYLLSQASSKRFACGAGTLAGIAIVLKTWPLFFIPYALLRLRRLSSVAIYLAAAAAVPFGAVALYLAVISDQFERILQTVTGYRSAAGDWGLSILLKPMSHFVPALRPLGHLAAVDGYLLLGASLVTATVVFHRAGWNWQRSCLGLVLVFAATSNAFALQYSVWIVPFAILADRRRELLVFVGAILLWMLPWYFLWQIFPLIPVVAGRQSSQIALYLLDLLGLVPWFVSLWWLASEIQRDRLQGRLPRRLARMSLP